MYINNLEKNWKNFVHISVKSFANLYISKLQGRLHQKKKLFNICIQFSAWEI